MQEEKNWMECSNHLINYVQVIAYSCLHELTVHEVLPGL